MSNTENYEFVSEFKNKILNTVISVVPDYPKTEISNEVLLNFSDRSQMLISSDYADVETPFHNAEDDSVLEISETINHEPFCNIEDFELSSIQVNKPVLSVDFVIDEASLPNDVNSTCRYLVAVFIRTQNHQFNIWKDLITGFYLHGDFHFGNNDGIYKPEERWDDYDFPTLLPNTAINCGSSSYSKDSKYSFSFFLPIIQIPFQNMFFLNSFGNFLYGNIGVSCSQYFQNPIVLLIFGNFITSNKIIWFSLRNDGFRL